MGVQAPSSTSCAPHCGADATHVKLRPVSTADASDGGSRPGAEESGDGGEPPAGGRRNPWIWVSVVLALVSIGLLVWGMNKQSDLDDANKQVEDLQSQLSKGKAAGGAATVTFKTVYEDLEQQLGRATKDLAATQQNLKDAEQASAKAQQDAAAAQQKASQTNNATDKANAEAEQAKAEAKAAESQTAIVTDCANAYLSALGSVVQSDNPSEQASAVKKDLQGMSDTCKKALEGT